jgi:hypothetical protein
MHRRLSIIEAEANKIIIILGMADLVRKAVKNILRIIIKSAHLTALF